MALYQNIDFSRWEILKDLDHLPWNKSELVHVFKASTAALLVNADGDLFQVEKEIEQELLSSSDCNRKRYREISKSSPAKLCVSNVTALASGFSHAVALDAEGVVYSWGCNNFGQLGNNTFEDNFIPTKVHIPEKIIKICCGYYCTLALDENYNVWFWGCLSNLSITFQKIQIPILVITGRMVVNISCGGRHAAMLTADGTLYMWGTNESGQIGLPYNVDALYQQPISGLPKDIQKVVCGGSSTAYLTSDGKVFCWGWLYKKETFLPEEIPLGGKAIDICANGENDLFTATLENYEVYYWGDDVSVFEQYPMISNVKNHFDVFENKKTPPVYRLEEISKTNGTNLFSDNDTLSQKIAKLFNAKQYSDLKIQLKNEELYTHKLILALQSKSLADFILNKLGGKKIIDFCESDALSTRAYIKYLYTNELEDVELSNVPELYNVANKDGKQDLKDCLLKKWTDNMNEDTIISMFESAYLMESKELAEACKPLLIPYLSKCISAELSYHLTFENINDFIQLALKIKNKQ